MNRRVSHGNNAFAEADVPAFGSPRKWSWHEEARCMAIKKIQPETSMEIRKTAVLAWAFCCGISGVSAAAPPGSDVQTTDQFVIRFDAAAAATGDAAAAQAVQEAAAAAGLDARWLRRTALGDHVLRLKQPMATQAIESAAEAMRLSVPAIAWVVPDRRMFTQALPNDPLLREQWIFFDRSVGINLAPARAKKATGLGVRVGVVDTGYRPHADLAANLIPGYDMIADRSNAHDGDGRDPDAQDPGDYQPAGLCGSDTPEPSSWHGTQMAGLIAAQNNNGIGLTSIAPKAQIQSVRALGRCGGYTSDTTDAAIWAAGGRVPGVPPNPTPVRVVNLSLGGYGACDPLWQAAIDEVTARGVTVVAAAGNNFSEAEFFSPGSCAHVITVASVARNGARAPYSNFGVPVALAAPGGNGEGVEAGDVISTSDISPRKPRGDGYAHGAGTSQATAMVSATVALMLQRNPALTPGQIKQRLMRSAAPFGQPCKGCGAGRLDVAAAVAAASH
jgi:serine protease